MALTQLQIEGLYAKQRERGRPMKRDKWGLKVLDVLREEPFGLRPKELQAETGLRQYQIIAGVKYLRQHHHDGGPVVYVTNENRWYCASLWPEHMRHAMRTQFFQPAASMALSGEQLLAQAEEQWPDKVGIIKRLIKDADRLREDAEELVAELK